MEFNFLNNARALGAVTHIVTGGFGSTVRGAGAYHWFMESLCSVTKDEVLYVPWTRRRLESPRAPKEFEKFNIPSAYVRQAMALHANLVFNGLGGSQIYLHGHSLGCPVSVVFRLLYGNEFRIIGQNLMNPANVVMPNALTLGWRVLGKRTWVDFQEARRANKVKPSPTSDAIADYYRGMPGFMFRNPVYAIDEWLAASSRFSIIPVLECMNEPTRTRVFIGLSEADEVFPIGQMLDNLDMADGLEFTRYHTPGRHDPEYFAPGLIEAMRDTGIL